jgi:hypothetical protein
MTKEQIQTLIASLPELETKIRYQISTCRRYRLSNDGRKAYIQPGWCIY